MKTKIIISSFLALALCSSLYAVPNIDQNDLDEVRTEITKNIQEQQKSQRDYLNELYNLIYYGKTRKVKELLDSKVITVATVNTPILYRGTNTCLTLAAELGYTKIVQYLIDYGADLNLGEWNDTKPLSLAALNGHFEIVKLLLENGANIELPELYSKRKPFYYAITGGNFEIIKIFIDHGVQVNNGHLILAVDTDEDRSDIIKLLIDNGADVNAIREEDTHFIGHIIHKSALHYAVFPHISVANAKSLIEKGADVNIQNAKGNTPLHVCAIELLNLKNKREIKKIAQLLFENGADINIKNNEGKSVKDINPNLVKILEKAKERKDRIGKMLQGVISQGQIEK
ncbi:MAG: ankyrin repeat domain-containing protein [Elusimicrobiaceae bacterium]|nr:ankyrin repeat domain-containing protein [Elusimicrobiaceae bacterium]